VKLSDEALDRIAWVVTILVALAGAAFVLLNGIH
jgi:hypothetical protein